MQLRHFRYFIAAAEEGSFLKAAGRLRVAQPSLSRQMRDLEREVGVTLFERLPRGVRMTPAGEVFLKEARNTLECAARAVAVARHEGAADKMLRLAHGTLFLHATTISRVLAAYRAQYPETNVTIRRMNETRQRAALRERRIDVAVSFIATPTIEGLSTHLLVNSEIRGVVIPACHALAKQSSVSLRDLRDMTWLRVSRKAAPELYRTIKTALQVRGLPQVREVPRPRDPGVATMHVAAGDGWMLASEEVGQMFTIGNPAVVYRPFVEPPIPSWLALLSLAEPSTPNVAHLIEIAGKTV
jgi:DNA-binding transcriptional LysR family regulator